MKRIIAAAGLCGILLLQDASADALKNILSSKLKQKEEIPGMVNLDALSQSQPVKPKSRSSKAIVATINGVKIRKREVDSYLSKRTQGKVKDFDLLPKEQRLALIKEMALPRLLIQGARSEIPKDEREAVLTSAWMQKQVADAKISNEELQTAYEKIKAQTKAKSALAQLPPLEKIKDRLKIQIVEQRIVAELMQGAQVRIADDQEGIAGYVGMMPISIGEVDKALQRMTQGKVTWKTLPPRDRSRVLQMIAPGKFVALAAKNGFDKKQQETILSNYWMQKSLARIGVTDKEAKTRYNRIKKRNKKSKSKKRLPDYATLEKDLKMQIAKEKFVEGLVKKAKIRLK